MLTHSLKDSDWSWGGGMMKDSGKSVLLSSTAVVDIPELSSASHEEADTRIFCHLQYAVQHHGYQRAVIQAADSDIILMALYHTVHIIGLKELWIQKAQKFLPSHEIAQNVAIKTNMNASLITSILLTVYILTGCDTVSYPYRWGKKKAFETALYCKEQLKPLADYDVSGSALTINSNVLATSKFYFIRLHTSHDFKDDLNALRAHMFATTKGDLRSLTPTENAFYFHVFRSLHQMALSERTHESDPDIPDPLIHGRKLLDGTLVPVMMDKDPKPNITRQAKYCGCRKNCCHHGCICARAKVKCVIACRCAADPK